MTRAEVKVATMLVKNNIPLALADEMIQLFCDIFTDIAKLPKISHVDAPKQLVSSMEQLHLISNRDW